MKLVLTALFLVNIVIGFVSWNIPSVLGWSMALFYLFLYESLMDSINKLLKNK